MAFIDGTVVNVALPALQTNLGATVVDVQWVVESYGLFLGALILVGGSAGDLFGRRRMFLAGVAVFAIASACCGLALTIHQLVIARAAQGAGAAFMVPGSLSVISASFAERDRGRAIGTWSGFTAITTALGPVLGGWLIEHASWRWVFFINIPLAVVVIAVSLRHVPESRSAGTRRIDWLDALLAALGLAGLVTGFIDAARLGWTHPVVLGSLIIGLTCLLLFSVVEANSNSPMIPVSLFKSTALSGANLLTFFLYSALGIFFFLFPLDLIQVHGYSATAAGAAALPRIGPLGGIDQLVPFAPYDAIYREAVVSSSPFYRLLCAFRIYDGTTEIRRWLREQCEQHRIAERMPQDPQVTPEELHGLGFAPEAVNGVRRARDLFERFRDHRNAIAHFLVEGEQGQAHVYLADGVMIRTYSVGAAGLLKYAHQTLRELRMFYTAHLEPILMRGMVLPLPEQRDRYVVRDNL